MYIGIDLGTSSLKAILVNEKGSIIAESSSSYALQSVQENWAEQDPQDWWKACDFCVREILQKTRVKEVDAISFSGQMHGLVAINDNLEVIRPAILWCDQRTSEECIWLNQNYKEQILKWTKNRVLAGFSAPKLLWLQKHEPQNFNKIYKILLPKDYLNFCLGGGFYTDASDASGTLLFDVEKKQWSREMLKICGIQLGQLPRVMESSQSCGFVKDEIQKSWGITNRIEIIAGAGDQAASAIGCGVLDKGSCMVSLGTSGVVFLPQDDCETNGILHTFAHANGSYHQMGVTLSAAASLSWWMNILKSSDYQELIEVEAKQQTADNLYFLPYLIGERTPYPDPNIKGGFLGLSQLHTRGDLTRAVLEGVIFSLKDCALLSKQKITKIRLGGGGSQSQCWCQILADVFQVNVEVMEGKCSGAYGAAMLAYGGHQNISICSVSKDWTKTKSYITFQQEKRDYYQKKYETYHTLYQLIKPLYNETKQI